MHILIAYVGFIVRIGPMRVHELNSLVNAYRIQRVIISQHEFLYLLLHEHPIDFESWTERLIVV